MPRTLSEPEFNAIRDRLLAEAPKGLDEAGFNRWFKPRFDGAIAEAENRPATPEGSAVRRFVSNAADILNPVTAVQGLASAVAHPIDTARGLMQAQGDQFRTAADQFQQGRYTEAAGHAVAGALPLIGPAAAQAGEQIAEGDVAGGVGRGIGLVAGSVAAKPVAKAVGKAVQPVTRAVGRRLYQSALKPTKATLKGIRSVEGTDGARRILLDTGLDEGIPVTAKGAQKVGTLIDSLNQEVSRRIQAVSRNGATVDPATVEKLIADVADDFSNQINAQPELQAIETVRQNFRNNPSLPQRVVSPAQPANFAQGRATSTPAKTAPAPIPVEQAQAMKVNTYKGLRGKYGRELSGTIEAEKAGARGLREGIEQAVPEVADLNAAESRLIPLEQAIADAMVRRGNYGMFGLTPIVAAIPAVTHGSVLPLLAALTDRAPGVVSRAGIWINRAGRTGRMAQRVGRAQAAGTQLQTLTSPNGSQSQTTGSGWRPPAPAER